MDSQQLDWLHPGKREVTMVGSYIVEEGKQLHAGFGDSSELDVENVQFVELQPYMRLEAPLKAFIFQSLHINVTTFDDGLLAKINSIEKGYEQGKQTLWHRFWYGMGDKKDVVEAWLEVIPSEYGLSIIKAGIAVVFKLAEDSVDRREKILKTFSTLNETLHRLGRECGRFRSDRRVRKTADELHKAVVQAVEDMFFLLTKTKKKWTTKLTSKFRRENEPPEPPPPTLEEIIESLEAQTKDYNDAIDLARDETTQRIEALGISHALFLRQASDEYAHDRKQFRRELGDMKKDIQSSMRNAERSFQEVIQRESDKRDESQADMKTFLMRFLLEYKQNEASRMEAERLRQQPSYSSKHRAVVSLTTLCSILAVSSTAWDPHNPPDLEHMFKQPSRDLAAAIAHQARVPAKFQGQVQSLMTHEKFTRWLSHSHPSLILVDANIRESTLESLSAISVFSSTLVTSLAEAFPEAEVIQFFCGLHATMSDDWYGPNGLMRSLILQLLLKLNIRDPDMQTWNLDFINDREFLQDLEKHNLDSMGFVLHSLLYQFSPDTTIYCIVDTISCFDSSRLLDDLGTVMERFRKIINDNALVPVVKFLLTHPGESTRDIKSMPLFTEDPDRLVRLSRLGVVPGAISGRRMDHQLLSVPSHGRSRASSPLGSRASSIAALERKRSHERLDDLRGYFNRGEENDDYEAPVYRENDFPGY
ncbi:hypothetical protein B0I35DRAFT_440600 [Stachybotrys elegans]|uniref:Uncharacterized protein n=1 Tax=Stachybotrys elegans TaxID=80388 RepID=A0A8K0SHZ0_9HYPO|nr:hypothetical protein B0I35DRAFT_440600 [Stachybotrys elegans]